MNISVPDALREKMQPFDDKTNWSAIAAAAFQQEVDKLAYLASIDDPVKRRLKQTEMEDNDNAGELAVKAGREWAKHHARMVHLRRLHAASEHISEPTPDHLAKIILKDESARWLDVPGVDEYPEDFELEAGWTNGFVEGAMEVYAEV
ncbi:hypothetical protein [Paracraurococcus lichenis]|uniref:Uncharacterized protein n=1 Tax=Paracraurococcus lichenis TaxID=3064888 RepID=A0ABT9E886_9PROT|nr:hypothetical protein [Paracraurococcus sp. LOR1-02]MDO9712389.1 hypothetical protein [Paracraurococcus sp. LOR1-02]